jgi:hypothetical protein
MPLGTTFAQALTTFTTTSHCTLTFSNDGSWIISWSIIIIDAYYYYYYYYTGCPTTYQTRKFLWLACEPLLRLTTSRRTTDTFHFISHLRTYCCSNLVAISSLVLELLKNCRYTDCDIPARKIGCRLCNLIFLNVFINFVIHTLNFLTSYVFENQKNAVIKIQWSR